VFTLHYYTVQGQIQLSFKCNKEMISKQHYKHHTVIENSETKVIKVSYVIDVIVHI